MRSSEKKIVEVSRGGKERKFYAWHATPVLNCTFRSCEVGLITGLSGKASKVQWLISLKRYRIFGRLF